MPNTSLSYTSGAIDLPHAFRPHGRRVHRRHSVTARSRAAAAHDVQEAAAERVVAPVAARADRVPVHAPSEGWILLVGALLALAAVREGVRRMSENPLVARAKKPTRTDVAMGVVLVKEGLEGLGSWALRAPPRPARR